MLYSLILTKGPDLKAGEKTLTHLDGKSKDSNLCTIWLLEELSRYSHDGWRISSIGAGVQYNTVWRLTKNGRTNFLELKEFKDAEQIGAFLRLPSA